MQVERGKTRPNTMMTGHTGYITHARKIILPPTPQQETVTEETPVEEKEEMEDETV
jgi:hypothetical protein